MNKKTGVLLAGICLFLVMFPISANAVTIDNGSTSENVTTTNPDVFGDGTVSYNAATNTLTLTNAAISEITIPSDLIIEIVGICSVNNINQSASSYNYTQTVKGNGTLTVTNMFHSQGSIIFDGVTVSVNLLSNSGNENGVTVQNGANVTANDFSYHLSKDGLAIKTNGTFTIQTMFLSHKIVMDDTAVLNMNCVLGSTYSPILSLDEALGSIEKYLPAGYTIRDPQNSSSTEMYSIYDSNGVKATNIQLKNQHIHDFTSSGWQNNQSTHWQVCNCGAKQNESAHVFGASIVTKQPTTTETGVSQKTCTVCGYIQSSLVSVLPAAQTTAAQTTAAQTTTAQTATAQTTAAQTTTAQTTTAQTTAAQTTTQTKTAAATPTSASAASDSSTGGSTISRLISPKTDDIGAVKMICRFCSRL